MTRTSFPRVFWIANIIEVFERFAYYGIYMGFGIYLNYLGYSKSQLGIIQSLFLAFAYTIPIISGTFADKYGFKKMLIVSYLAYFPSIILLIFTKSFSGIALTMLSIGFAAGIFKPLTSGIIRTVTDKTNKTLGFGIYYAMVNIGGTFGPIIAGKLRIISWNYAFLLSAIIIGIMFIVTILFYKEPPRIKSDDTLNKKFNDLITTLLDFKFSLFLIIFGLFLWLPLWSFMNILTIYIDENINTVQLYINIKSVLGSHVADFISGVNNQGVRYILPESISNTGYVIILMQLFISRIAEKGKAMTSFLISLCFIAGGFVLIACAKFYAPALIFLGIFLFAIGEMLFSPRQQEFVTWIAPKEKAGLYMGSFFLSVWLGAILSGITYTSLYGWFAKLGHAEYVWFTLAIHCLIGIGVIYLFTRTLGDFKELES